MQEKWAHRADLAESAINERHSSKLWGIPRTNLAVVSWPPTAKDRLFVHWHYWWQAHYLDCQVDAALRRPARDRNLRIRNTIKGIRIRNLSKLTSNNYYDDKAWLALAMHRAGQLKQVSPSRALVPLEHNIIAGIDALTGVLPWRTGETFYNVPSNGPAAIMMARTGRLDQARVITDWIFDTLLNDDGLIADGQRMRMHGPEIVPSVHPYVQGVALGACLEIALKLRARAGFAHSEEIAGVHDAERADESMVYIARIRGLVQAIAVHMATPGGVIDWDTGDGDGGLFKGILVRYLADISVRLPSDSPANRAVKKIAARLVTASATSVWNRRLEVDGLPVFATDWTTDARLPWNYGAAPSSLSEAIGVIRIDERDLSVQLSGWMLMEAAARVSLAAETGASTGRS
ncbi:glycoside hydrolase family 76 protein [Corynebacterium alimapuense]|uniref:Glycoside hydrolase family 76 n=1 Tax=Corynebacterium alimapuense TaxID=1576874 RepID=A0A3M8K9U1_9CORY|nr:glycoside hydrolase family 76 protein [Corynebacterium alimapuense]RNE49930.1 glycoside hydrolase family 76 [Corynebacterium alimapuense]